MVHTLKNDDAYQVSNSSWSTHPFSDRPYIVPGISPLVSSGLRAFLSQITMGGRECPPALIQASTVICNLFPKLIAWALRSPTEYIPFGYFGTNGNPFSFILNVCHRLSNKSCSVIVVWRYWQRWALAIRVMNRGGYDLVKVKWLLDN